MKKIWNGLKGVKRVRVRIIVETFHRLIINLFDILFGFLNWPEKKLKIKIFILQDSQGNAVVSPKDLNVAIEYVKKSFKKNFNTSILPYHKQPFVEVLQKTPPNEVLHTKGGTGAFPEEFKITGSFFASNLCGSFYPVTIFIVLDIKGAAGCSLGPVTDYVTVDPNGAENASTLAHEIAHACGLWHHQEKSNLMWRTFKRGDEIKWWQKNIFRSSRHVTYW